MNTPNTAPFSLPGYHVRPLQLADHAIIHALGERCQDYIRLVTGLPPDPKEAQEMLTDRPASKSIDDKFIFGIFSEASDLIGILDAVRDYPEAETWFLGLLMIDPAHRSQGLGKRVYYAFEQWATHLGARQIKLGVAEPNTGALRFWQSLGFEIIERRPPKHYGTLEYQIIVMERPIR